MNHGISAVIYPVKDLDQAKTLYSKLLGAEPMVDSPFYVGWKVGDIDVGLDPNGHKSGLTGPVGYYQVDDIQATLQTLLDGGAQLLQPAKDVGGGMQVASVKDADGNILGIRQVR
ncbi:MAG TPA: VOC family protein [Ktedonobacterales bacterium]